MATKGDKGTYNGMEVEVTLVHEDDGTVDLQKVWPGTGSKENLPWYERINPDQFTVTEAAQQPDAAEAGQEPIFTNPRGDFPERTTFDDRGATFDSTSTNTGSTGTTFENVRTESNPEADPDKDEIKPAGV